MKPHLPAYIIHHHAAQDAGHFTPYHTMKRHIQPIVTNARRGLPVSTANRKARNPWPYILGGCALFWVIIVAAFLA